MKLEYAKNPVWANAEHTLIDLTIKWDELDFEIPFTANPNDVEEHGRAIFAECLEGKFGSISEYVAPVVVEQPSPTKEQLMAELQALTAKIQELE